MAWGVNCVFTLVECGAPTGTRTQRGDFLSVSSTSVFAGGGVFSRFSDVGMCGDIWGYIGAHVVEM